MSRSGSGRRCRRDAAVQTNKSRVTSLDRRGRGRGWANQFHLRFRCQYEGNFTNICGRKQNVSNQEDYSLDRRKKGKVFGGENQGTGGKAVKQRVCEREGTSTDADGRGKGGRGRTRVCPLSSPLLCPCPALALFPTSAGTPT